MKFKFIVNLKGNYSINFIKYDISKNKLYLQFKSKIFSIKRHIYISQTIFAKSFSFLEDLDSNFRAGRKNVICVNLYTNYSV